MKVLLVILLLVTVTLSSILMVPSSTEAVEVLDPVCSINNAPAVCDTANRGDQTSNNNIFVGENGIITSATQVLVWASGVLAAILIIIAGLMFVFSSGNPESAGRARRTVMYAVIGMVVAVAGQVIVTFVLDKL